MFVSGDLDKLAIRASFVYIKENLIFESVEDKVIEEGLLLDREKDDYIFKKPRSRQFSVERLIKHLIRKDKSTEFIKILSQMACHQHVYKKIQENRQWAQQTMSQDSISKIVLFFSYYLFKCATCTRFYIAELLYIFFYFRQWTYYFNHRRNVAKTF